MLSGTMLVVLFVGVVSSQRSITSRINGVVPFFPFPEFEQMILTQQCLLALKQSVSAPVKEVEGRLHGNIHLQLYDQPEVSRFITCA
jgi:hypothetical protein